MFWLFFKFLCEIKMHQSIGYLGTYQKFDWGAYLWEGEDGPNDLGFDDETDDDIDTFQVFRFKIASSLIKLLKLFF